MTVANFILRTAVTGAVAAAASGVAAAAGARYARHHPLAPINAVSHIAWGGEPSGESGPGGRNTLVGTALHAGAAVFWATGFEALFGRVARRSATAAVVGGAAVSAVAFVTDYYLVSRRFQPGYERFLTPRGLAVLYGALALGFAMGGRFTGLPGSGRLHHHQIEDDREREEGNKAQHAPQHQGAPVRGW